VVEEAAPMAQQLGLRVSEDHAVQIKTVLRGGAAEAAGFMPGDEWLAVDDWRLARLDDLGYIAGQRSSMLALVARDRRLLRLTVKLPPKQMTWRLVVKDAALVKSWLTPAG
jgi:predicted metalloprotease with PDZ domain